MKALEYIYIAREYIEGSLQRISYDFDEFISFINGNVGVYSIASVIYDTLGETMKAQHYLEKVKEVQGKPFTHLVDYDDGIAGFLYAVEFLESYYQRQIFDREFIVSISKHLFEYGYNHRLENGTLVFPEPPPDNRVTIGFGRGTSG